MTCQEQLDSCVSSCGAFDWDCSESCEESYWSYSSCVDTPVSHNSSSSSNFNVVKSVNGATVQLDDSVLANEVWQPMFFWYWQLLNVAITFVPVVVCVSMFRLIYWYLKGLWNRNSLESKKSLDNK